MVSRHIVYMAEDQVGVIQLKTAGLYYEISCMCNFSAQGMYDLWVQTGDGSEKLGLLTPCMAGFRINTRIPAKRLGQGSARFYIVPRNSKGCEQFEVLDHSVPFRHLAELEQGRFARRGVAIGILFQNEK